MIIKNFDSISRTESRKLVLNMIEEGIKSILPETLLRRCLKFDGKNLFVKAKKYALEGRVFVFGAGKASGKMAEAIEKIIGSEHITYGFVNSSSAKIETEKIIINFVGHPYPDAKGMAGTRTILSAKTKYNINKKDIVLFLFSGGGSAMLPCPADGITLDNKIKLTELLLMSGATINEINTIRKHISKVKGGKLAEA